MGTVITKEYNGETHEVIVTPQDFEYRGEIYKSLTCIANMITGTSWSVPMFFGLKSKSNVVVYKVDRLSRSLADFAQLVDLFDKHNMSFLSVTQQFNTTSSMGRLTLNIGEIGNKGECYPGEHEPIISMDLWAKTHGTFDVHAQLRSKSSKQRNNPSFLKGMLVGPDGLPPAARARTASSSAIT